MIDVNVTAVVRLTHAAGRAMLKRKRGDIINVGSVAGFTPSIRPSSTYAATKSFVSTFSEGLAPTFSKSGVTISAVCPGWVRTDFHSRAGINMSKLPNFLWLTPEETVKTALRDHRAGRALSFPGWPYKAFMGLLRVLPRSAQHGIGKLATRHQH
jgi:short-subunit dehydrogenase